MFSDAVTLIAQQRPNDITQILSQLNQSQVDQLKKLASTKRIVLGGGVNSAEGQMPMNSVEQMDPSQQKP